MYRRLTPLAAATTVGILIVGYAGAEPLAQYNLSQSGVPGIIDMPSSGVMPDGELSATIATFAGITRSTLTFQISDRLSGSFRYSATENWPNDGHDTYFDRSFDLRYRLFDETMYMPAVTVGLQDFVGTGLNSAEYIVASKHLGKSLRVSGGIGWGRLATYNSFSNPFGLDDRPTDFEPTGGNFNLDRWFRGDAAFFGGIEWQATEKLRLMAEYSSDAYVEETSRSIVDHRSPFNFGVNYTVRPGIDIAAYYLYGSEIGARISFALNPKNPPAGAGSENAPLPVNVNSRAAALSWPSTGSPSPAYQARLLEAASTALKQQDLVLEALRIEGATATVRFRNPTYDVESQALGRAARALTYAMPSEIRFFRLVPVKDGLPLSAITINRQHLIQSEHAADGGAQLFETVEIFDATFAGEAGQYNDELYPQFSWSISPYISTVIFGLEDPLLGDVGLQFGARYDISPGLSVTGAIRKRLIGNLDDNAQVPTTALEPVRTEKALYDRTGDPSIERLTLDYLFRPGPNLYGRLSAGYFEQMFGGVSGEILWKPVGSRLAIGTEINYAIKRDYDQMFGFQDYDVISGHVSGYYQFNNGFHAQIDAGRYLAGDWGATVSLNREFANGWKVGAFMTLTDVSFEEFGDGSFDKGIQLTIPLASFTGQPSRSATDITLRPFYRDGGARLNVPNRLYETVRDYHEPKIADSWGRFLR